MNKVNNVVPLRYEPVQQRNARLMKAFIPLLYRYCQMIVKIHMYVHTSMYALYTFSTLYIRKDRPCCPYLRMNHSMVCTVE